MSAFRLSQLCFLEQITQWEEKEKSFAVGVGKTEKGETVKFWAIGMVSGFSAGEMGEAEQEIKPLKVYVPPSLRLTAPRQAS